jgi:hypothetical protein
MIQQISAYININVLGTGLYLPYSLGVLGYIKKNINIPEYKLTGISGGAWISLIYCLEDDLSDYDKIWKYIVNDSNYEIKLNRDLGKYMDKVSNNLMLRYENIDNNVIKSLPISIISTRINNIPKNVKISDFNNIKDLIDFCSCSSYIPYLSGEKMYKKYKENCYIDGSIYENKNFIKTKKTSINVHRNMWGRKFNFSNFFYSDYKTSEKLFKYGWYDTEKNIESILKLIKQTEKNETKYF